MNARALRRRTLLLMWEYTSDYSPLWPRSADLDSVPTDAAELGIPAALREELADWNRRMQRLNDWELNDSVDLPPDAVDPAESYRLAARVQRALGDSWTVWCCGGGGDGGLQDPGALGYRIRFDGPLVVLRRTGVLDWTAEGTAPLRHRFSAGLNRAIADWTADAGAPATAELRAEGLDLAGRIRSELGRGTVFWFGGEGAQG